MTAAARTHFARALIVRGVWGLVFGVAAIALPVDTLVVLVVLFGIFALADGVIAFAAAAAARAHDLSPWPFVVEGALGVGAGVTALVVPGVTVLALLVIMAAWSMAAGVFRIAAAVHLRRRQPHEWLLALSGAAGIAFGLVVVRYPEAGAVGVVTVLGAYAVLLGLMLVVLGMRLRRRGARPVPA